MKQIKLTREKYALVDDEDYEWLNQWKWYANKGGNTYYAVRNMRCKNGKRTIVTMHREILKPKKELVCDHINGNGLDNRRENLRICTQAENLYNRQPQKNTLSGFKGVHWHNRDKLWQARITCNHKRINLGFFKRQVDAARAYNKAALLYHGTFARLNEKTI